MAKKKGSKKISMPLSNIGSSSMTLQKHIHRIMLMKKHQRQGLIAFFVYNLILSVMWQVLIDMIN